MQTLLIQCAGHGLGNATRILAIIEALRAIEADPNRLRIEVATWGKSLSWFKRHKHDLSFDLTELDPFRPSPTGLPAYFRNCRTIGALADRIRPTAVLLDSDLHIPPLLRRKIPLFCLGQAHEVLRRARTWHLLPRNASEWKSLLLFEVLDAWIQRRIARRIFVPCASPHAFLSNSQIQAVPLIVRRAFQETPAQPANKKTAPIGMLLSGSGIEAERLTAWAKVHGIAVIPCSIRDDGRPAIDDYRALIIQGGLSSISECIARRRAMIVVPIKGHFEQRVNAYEVEMQGLGGYRCLDLERDGDASIDRLRVSSFLFEMPDAEITATNGAHVVAQEIFKSLRNERRAAP